MQAAYPLGASSVVAFKTSPCFVDHLWELFGPLLLGGLSYSAHNFTDMSSPRPGAQSAMMLGCDTV